MSATEFYYPCDGQHHETIDAYYPLTLEDVRYLLHKAHTYRHDCQAVNALHVRLHQGIPGTTCPRRIVWYTDPRTRAVDRIYLAFLDQADADLEETAQRLAAVLNASQDPQPASPA